MKEINKEFLHLCEKNDICPTEDKMNLLKVAMIIGALIGIEESMKTMKRGFQ